MLVPRFCLLVSLITLHLPPAPHHHLQHSALAPPAQVPPRQVQEQLHAAVDKGRQYCARLGAATR